MTSAAMRNTTPPVAAATMPILGPCVVEPDPPAPVSDGNPDPDFPVACTVAVVGVPPVATTEHASVYELLAIVKSVEEHRPVSMQLDSSIIYVDLEQMHL